MDFSPLMITLEGADLMSLEDLQALLNSSNMDPTVLVFDGDDLKPVTLDESELFTADAIVGCYPVGTRHTHDVVRIALDVQTMFREMGKHCTLRVDKAMIQEVPHVA